MKKITALFVASTLALGMANLSYAEETSPVQNEKGAMKHHKGAHGHFIDMKLKNLKLSDAQKQQIDDIMKEQREKMSPPSLEEKRALHELITSDTFDKAKAEAQVDQMTAQHKAMILGHLEAQNKIYNILTPEQKKQFNANFEKHLTDHDHGTAASKKAVSAK